MQFTIRKTSGSKYIPAAGEEVILEEDTVRIFGGVIVEIEEYVEDGILLGYSIRCKDYSHLLDRKLARKSYENTTAGAIINDLISTYTTGFTTTNVPASTPAVASAKFNYEQITRSIAKIANAVGWDWYVDYNALKTAEAIKGAEHKKKILILDTEKKTEEQLEEWFATLLTTHDVTSIDQIGKQRFAVTALENAPDIK